MLSTTDRQVVPVLLPLAISLVATTDELLELMHRADISRKCNVARTVDSFMRAGYDTFAKIAAAGYVGITSDANVDAETYSYADGRGFGGGGYAETKFDIVDSQSLVTLGDNAVVIAGTTALRATTSNMNLNADAKGYGAGFVGVSDNFAKINIDAENKVELVSGSSLTGYRGVDIEAIFNNVNTYAYSYGRVTGAFGVRVSKLGVGPCTKWTGEA